MAEAAQAAGREIRRVRPSDGDALKRFYAGLSAESTRARFLGPVGGLSDSLSRSFCTPDHAHAEGFVALAPDGRLVGHLCLEPAGDGHVELAIAVADEWQGRGIGRAIFEAALEWARRQRLLGIVASAYADNGPVLRLLSSAPYPAMISPSEAGTVNVTIPLVAALPSAWRLVPQVDARARPRCRGQRGSAPARGRCRVFWRRTRPPARDAAG